jgi:hypothetical protein
MKNSTRLTALFLLATTSLFAVAAGPFQPTNSSEKIIFSSMPSLKGIMIHCKKIEPGKAIVIIYDSNKNVLRKDVMPTADTLKKGYVLNQLPEGEYTVEVTANKQVATKAFRVYMEGHTKTFMFKN